MRGSATNPTHYHTQKCYSPDNMSPELRSCQNHVFTSTVSQKPLPQDKKSRLSGKINRIGKGSSEYSIKHLESSLSKEQKKFKDDRNSKHAQLEEWLQNGSHMNEVYPIKCLRHANCCVQPSLYVCLQENCCDLSHKSEMKPQQGKQKDIRDCNSLLQQRILCQQCINEQLHRSHLICTLNKFQQLVYDYHWSSIQAAKTMLSKIMQLRHNLDHFINDFSLRVIQIMTLGLCGDFRQFQAGCQSNQKQIQASKTNSKNKNLAPSKSSRLTQTSMQETIQKMKHIFSKISLQTWRELLTVSKSTPQSNINKILSFKEESIAEQIQDINASFQLLIAKSVENIRFINENKDYIFNPDDMGSEHVGLTLDRNKLEAVFNTGNEYSRYVQKQECNRCHEDNTLETKVCNQKCKIAFTQTPLLSEESRSFRIQSIKSCVVVGCVSSEDHLIIANELNYQNYEHLAYGLMINKQGKVQILQKGCPSQQIQKVKIKPTDIIQFTFHHKQRSFVIIKYSRIEKQTQNQKQIQIPINYDRKKQTITVLQLQNMNEPLCYIFAGVTVEGDCISLIENVERIERTNNRTQQKRESERSSQFLSSNKAQINRIYFEGCVEQNFIKTASKPKPISAYRPKNMREGV